MNISKIKKLTFTDPVDTVVCLPNFSLNPINAELPLAFELTNSNKTLSPIGFWPPGVTFMVTLQNGVTSRYFVEPDSVFEPDQILIHKNINTLEQVALYPSLGILESSELKVLSGASQPAKDYFNKLINILVQTLVYSGSRTSSLGKQIRGLRLIQQYLYMFGLESIPRYTLPVSSCDHDWFFSNFIAGARLDEDIISELGELEELANKLISSMQRTNSSMGLDMVETVSQVIDNQDPRFNLLRKCALAIVGLAY